MDTAKTMNVSLKNVYQLLISEMRYGYRRNNHLMPSCGYDKVKTLVPQMYEVDKEYAVYTQHISTDPHYYDETVMCYVNNDELSDGYKFEMTISHRKSGGYVGD